jgi:hypothetical protein
MNPYPGLRPFRGDEQHLFMGREAAVSSLLTRLRLSPITLLIARSGVGKSSFLTCRVIPQLREMSYVRYRNEWGADRSDSLIGAEVSGALREGPGNPETPVVIFDQFEDVFKLPERTEILWETFSEIVHAHEGRVHLLISMREEWLGAWTESMDYLTPSATTLFRLAPLSDKEVLSAMLGPAALEGTVEADGQLADEIFRDLKRPSAFGLGQAYVEPGLLQLVMSSLWTAADETNKKMNVALYNRMGRADQICRGFVWSELGRAGAKGSLFDQYDRVLWSGMTRHLVVAYGIKAIADPTSMSRKLRLDDLGLAGSTTVESKVARRCAEYLRAVPERREAPPAELVAWVKQVLDKGVSAGLLKKQHGLVDGRARGEERTALRDIYELSHDFLGVLLQQFALEFEVWVRSRYGLVVLAVFGLTLVGSGLIVIVPLLWEGKYIEVLLLVAAFVGAMLIYALVLYVLSLIFGPIIRFVWNGVFRRVISGSVPYPSADVKRPSFFGRVRMRLERRLGFAPR